jgi:hypothetical protein
MFRIISWNVLYRGYEEQYNPKSRILSAYPDEKERIAAVVDMVSNNVTENTVVCLQEVSKDVLDVLRVTFVAHNIFSHHIRNDEYLVTITPPRFSLLKSFKHPVSNGFLVVTDKKSVIINCHLVPQRACRENIMEYLSTLSGNNVFIAGDFNEEHSKVKLALSSWCCPYYGNTYKGRPIDHIVWYGLNTEYISGRILQRYISDHHMIGLEIPEQSFSEESMS